MPTALNLALILPEEWNAEARRLNAQLSWQPNPVPLAAGDAVPHITLAMGVVEDEKVHLLPDLLRRRFYEEWRMPLVPELTYARQELTEVDVTGVAIQKNDRLQALHEGVMEVLIDLGLEMPTMGALYGGPDGVDPITLRLIQHFREVGVFDDYFPHLTLGLGTLPPGSSFHGAEAQAGYLGIFRMGNFCTCREELYRLDLADNHDIAAGGFEGGWRIAG